MHELEGVVDGLDTHSVGDERGQLDITPHRVLEVYLNHRHADFQSDAYRYVCNHSDRPANLKQWPASRELRMSRLISAATLFEANASSGACLIKQRFFANRCKSGMKRAMGIFHRSE
jgi:signal transduction protein with GAF and PtsI domain